MRQGRVCLANAAGFGNRTVMVAFVKHKLDSDKEWQNWKKRA